MNILEHFLMVMDKKDSNIITNIFACEILSINAASWTFYKTLSQFQMKGHYSLLPRKKSGMRVLNQYLCDLK